MNGVTEYLQTYRSMLYTDANGEEKTAYVIVPQDLILFKVMTLYLHNPFQIILWRNDYSLFDRIIIQERRWKPISSPKDLGVSKEKISLFLSKRK